MSWGYIWYNPINIFSTHQRTESSIALGVLYYLITLRDLAKKSDSMLKRRKFTVQIPKNIIRHPINNSDLALRTYTFTSSLAWKYTSNLQELVQNYIIVCTIDTTVWFLGTAVFRKTKKLTIYQDWEWPKNFANGSGKNVLVYEQNLKDWNILRSFSPNLWVMPQGKPHLRNQT